jgi:hypothetical protein
MFKTSHQLLLVSDNLKFKFSPWPLRLATTEKVPVTF